MTCSEFIPRLELMADDELSSDLAAQTLAHIEDCADCTEQWYGILNLKKSIKERAQSFTASPDFENRIIKAVREEVKQESVKTKAGQPAATQNNVTRFKRDEMLAYAAALVGVIVAAAILIKPAISPVAETANKPVIKSASFIANNAVGTPVLTPSSPSSPATLAEAMAYFDTYVKAPRGTTSGGAPTSEKQKIDSISTAAGFAVKPMSLSGFKLDSAYMANLGVDKKPVVALCYLRNVKGKTDHIICYQAPGGKLTAAGLNEHLIDGKKICCGEKGDRAIVYIPSSSASLRAGSKVPAVLLLSTISKSDLMDLVLSNS